MKQQKNKEIFEEIQRQRMRMIETAREKGFTNDETIRQSQELDRLIYEYQCLFGSTAHKKKRSRRFTCRGMVFYWAKNRLTFKNVKEGAKL